MDKTITCHDGSEITCPAHITCPDFFDNSIKYCGKPHNHGDMYEGGAHVYDLKLYPFLAISFFDNEPVFPDVHHPGSHLEHEPEECVDPCEEIREERDWLREAYGKLLAETYGRDSPAYHTKQYGQISGGERY